MLQWLSCPVCLQKEHSIVCMIFNSIIDFLYINCKLYAFEGISRHKSGCESYGISGNCMILLG